MMEAFNGGVSYDAFVYGVYVGHHVLAIVSVTAIAFVNVAAIVIVNAIVIVASWIQALHALEFY
jgi:hypothetical protein